MSKKKVFPTVSHVFKFYNIKTCKCKPVIINNILHIVCGLTYYKNGRISSIKNGLNSYSECTHTPLPTHIPFWNCSYFLLHLPCSLEMWAFSIFQIPRREVSYPQFHAIKFRFSQVGSWDEIHIVPPYATFHLAFSVWQILP